MNVHPLNPIGMEITVKSPKVCFTVCRPRKTTPNLGESCTTVMFEGELEKALGYCSFSPGGK